MAPINTKIQGQSGRSYIIDKVLQRKEHLRQSIYRATTEQKFFVLKEVPNDHFQEIVELHHKLPASPYLRLLRDTNVEHSMLIYDYLRSDLMQLGTIEDLPLQSTKRILKNAVQGLAALHEKDFVHTDIKANNILVEWEYDQHGQFIIQDVQITDLEDACHVPPNIHGLQVGNWMWRSPEANAMGPVNTPSDIFSFGLVCIYMLTKRVVLAVDESELEPGEVLLSHVIARQISYFADADGMAGLLRHLGDSPWTQVFEVLRDDFGESNPRKPFVSWRWDHCDEENWRGFKSLIEGLTRFDPATRLTAKEALDHSWFRGV